MDQHPYSPFRGGGDYDEINSDPNRARAFSSPGARGTTADGGSGIGAGRGGDTVGGIDLSSLSFGAVTPTASRQITAPTTPMSAGAASHQSSGVGIFPLPSPSSQSHQKLNNQLLLTIPARRQPISPPLPSPARSPLPLSTQRLVASIEAGGAVEGGAGGGSGAGTGAAAFNDVRPSSSGGVGSIGMSPSSRASGSSPIAIGMLPQRHRAHSQERPHHQQQQQQQPPQFLVPAQLAIPSITSDSRHQQQQQHYQHPHQQQQQYSPVGDENRPPSDHRDGVDPDFEADYLAGGGGVSGSSEGNYANSADNDSGDNAAAAGGGGRSSSVVKLFVGQVPKTSDESDLVPIFAPYGPLADVSIIRDRFSLGHRGCAFVTYHNADDALRAMEDVHDNVKFDGSKRPLQVRVAAEPGVGRPSESEIEHKLFVGMLSRSLGEREIKALFEPYGQVRSVFLIRNQDGTRKGCAFVRMQTQEAADAAIDGLSGTFTCHDMARPIIVKYADTKYQRRARLHFQGKRDQQATSAAVAPRPGTAGQYHPPALGGVHPSQAGYYQQQYQYAPPPQGVSLQGGQEGGHGLSDASALHAGVQHHSYGGPSQGYGYQQAGLYAGNDDGVGGSGGGGQGTYPSTGPRPKEGPPGANLFIYHLPHDLTDADLATAFDPFGNVVSAKVYVDRHTGESKGFGFVSYDSIEAADNAIEQMNGFQIGAKRLKVQHKRVNRQGGGGSGGSGGGGGPRPYAQQQQHYGGGESYGGQYGRGVAQGQGDITALSGNFANLSTSNGMGANEETF